MSRHVHDSRRVHGGREHPVDRPGERVRTDRRSVAEPEAPAERERVRLAIPRGLRVADGDLGHGAVSERRRLVRIGHQPRARRVDQRPARRRERERRVDVVEQPAYGTRLMRKMLPDCVGAEPAAPLWRLRSQAGSGRRQRQPQRRQLVSDCHHRANTTLERRDTGSRGDLARRRPGGLLGVPPRAAVRSGQRPDDRGPEWRGQHLQQRLSSLTTRTSGRRTPGRKEL